MEINKKTGECERIIKPWEKWLGNVVVLVLAVIVFYALITSPVNEGGSDCYGQALWDC